VQLCVLLFYTLISSIQAQGGPLQFIPDSKAQDKGWWMYSSILPVTQDPKTITPEILVGLARDALLEMRSTWLPNWRTWTAVNRKKPYPGQTPPTVATALLVSNRIYLTSSLLSAKGLAGFSLTMLNTKEGAVRKLLLQSIERCSHSIVKSDTETGHYNQAACGEVMALHLYDLETWDPDLDLLEGMIVTVEIGEGKDANTGQDLVKIKKPCTVDQGQAPAKDKQGRVRGSYGCSQVLRETKVREVSPNTNIPSVTLNVRYATPQHISILC
jgi:hypothetical protein